MPLLLRQVQSKVPDLFSVAEGEIPDSFFRIQHYSHSMVPGGFAVMS